MSFPLSPTNNQIALVNGIEYYYNTTKGAWYRYGDATANVITSNTFQVLSSLIFSDGTSQTSAASPTDSYARTTANTNSNNITIIQGVDVGQNTRMTIIEGVDVGQNTRMSIIEGVDVTQNTNITNAINAAQAAFAQANTVYLPSVTRLDVTNSGASAYLLDQYSGNNPTIYINAGETIAFNLNVTGHPFMIRVSSGGSNYDTGLTHITNAGVVTTGSNAQGKVSGILFWKVPFDIAGNTYVYQCSAHAGMVGSITIGQPSSIVLSTLQGVNTTQNTNITNADTKSQAAFDKANAANSLAQAAYNQANTGGGGGGGSVLESTVDTFTGNGSNTAFTLSTTPATINYTTAVIGGVTQPRSAYSVVGTTLTFTSAPANTQIIEVTTIGTSNTTLYTVNNIISPFLLMGA